MLLNTFPISRPWVLHRMRNIPHSKTIPMLAILLSYTISKTCFRHSSMGLSKTSLSSQHVLRNTGLEAYVQSNHCIQATALTPVPKSTLDSAAPAAYR